jgi:hypothetical protein
MLRPVRFVSLKHAACAASTIAVPACYVPLLQAAQPFRQRGHKCPGVPAHAFVSIERAKVGCF